MKNGMLSMTIVCVLMSMFTGCMSLGAAKSSQTRFFLLVSKPDSMVSNASVFGLADTAVGIGPVTIPDYLDRPQLITRLEGSELRVNEFRQWAEPLRDNITRVLEENLAALTGANQVHAIPLHRSAEIDLQVVLDILQFDGAANGQVTLKAVWRIIDPEGYKTLKVKRSTFQYPSNGSRTADVVEAMSAALFELSQEIAGGLDDLAQR
jgi:hypothetical protein